MTSGRGIFEYAGDGSVFGSLADGVLSASGEGVVEVEGNPHQIRPGKILRLPGISGSLYIRGSGLVVTIKGFRLDLNTVGSGSACLDGEGHLHRRRLHPEAVSFHSGALPRFAVHRIG